MLIATGVGATRDVAAAGSVSVSESHTYLGNGTYRYTYEVTNTSSGGERAKQMRYAFKEDVVLTGCSAAVLLGNPWLCAGVVIGAILLDPAGTLTDEAVQFDAAQAADYMDPGDTQTFTIEATSHPGHIEYLYEFEDGSYVIGPTVGPIPGGVGGVSLDVDAGAVPLQAGDSSGFAEPLRVGVVAAAVAAVGVGGAAWYAWRRRLG